MTQFTQALWSDQSGQDLVEYVLIILVIALGVFAALTALKGGLSSAFNKAANDLNSQAGT